MTSSDEGETQPGWYQDPENDSQLRFWDGSAWGATKPKSRAQNIGNSMQSAGNDISKLGCSCIWIVVGLGILLLILLVLL